MAVGEIKFAEEVSVACKIGRRMPEVARLLVVRDDCIRGKCVADYWIIKVKRYPMATDDTNTVMSDSGALLCTVGRATKA